MQLLPVRHLLLGEGPRVEDLLPEAVIADVGDNPLPVPEDDVPHGLTLRLREGGVSDECLQTGQRGAGLGSQQPEVLAPVVGEVPVEVHSAAVAEDVEQGLARPSVLPPHPVLGEGVHVAIRIDDRHDDPVVHVHQVGVGGVGDELSEYEGDRARTDPLPGVDPALYEDNRLVLSLAPNVDRHQLPPLLGDPQDLQPDPGAPGGEALQPGVDGVEGMVVVPVH